MDKDDITKLVTLNEALNRKKVPSSKDEPSSGISVVFIISIFLIALIFIITK